MEKGQSCEQFLDNQKSLLNQEIKNNQTAYTGELAGINQNLKKAGLPQLKDYGRNTPESSVQSIDYYKVFKSIKGGIDE